jgi:hypothetical protein
MKKYQKNASIDEKDFFVDVNFQSVFRPSSSQDLSSPHSTDQPPDLLPGSMKDQTEYKNPRKKWVGIKQPVFSPLVLSANVSGSLNRQKTPSENEENSEMENVETESGKAVPPELATFRNLVEERPKAKKTSMAINMASGFGAKEKSESKTPEEPVRGKMDYPGEKGESKGGPGDAKSILKSLFAGKIKKEEGESDASDKESKRKSDIFASIDKTKKKNHSQDTEKSKTLELRLIENRNQGPVRP